MLNLITILVLTLWGLIELSSPLANAAARAELERRKDRD